MLFHKKVQDFMRHYINNAPHLVGRVVHYVIRYEVQDRGSLHAHIILWVQTEDIVRVSDEICGMVPAEFIPDDPDDPKSGGTFQDSPDPSKLTLHKLVLRKNMHTCTPVGLGNKGSVLPCRFLMCKNAKTKLQPSCSTRHLPLLGCKEDISVLMN